MHPFDIAVRIISEKKHHCYLELIQIRGGESKIILKNGIKIISSGYYLVEECRKIYKFTKEQKTNYHEKNILNIFTNCTFCF